MIIFLRFLVAFIGLFSLYALMKETSALIGFYIFLILWSNNISVANAIKKRIAERV